MVGKCAPPKDRVKTLARVFQALRIEVGAEKVVPARAMRVSCLGGSPPVFPSLLMSPTIYDKTQPCAYAISSPTSSVRDKTGQTCGTTLCTMRGFSRVCTLEALVPSQRYEREEVAATGWPADVVNTTSATHPHHHRKQHHRDRLGFDYGPLLSFFLFFCATRG